MEKRQLTVNEKNEIAKQMYDFVVALEKENVKSNAKMLVSDKTAKISNYLEGIYNEYENKEDNTK